MIEKIKLNDIADAAGVSVSSVCRAIKSPESVKETTLDKVNKAMASLGYMKKGCTYTPIKQNRVILVIMSESSSLFYNNIISGIETVVSYHGYNAFFKICPNYCDMTLEKILNYCQCINASGLIVLHGIRDISILRELDNYLPVVQCCDSSPESGVSSVAIDDYACGKKLTNYLLKTGRRRIALISVSSYPYSEKREKGFRDVLAENSIDVDEQLVVHLKAITYESAYVSTLNLLSLPNPPDAIFAISDTIAAAALSAAKKLGIRVPAEVGIVGVDNTLYSQISTPAITSVSQPNLNMGSLACEILINEIVNRGTEKTIINQDFELIIRDST